MSKTCVAFDVEKPNDINLNHITWDEYFMSLAILSSLRSKDPGTKVGACIVGDDHRIKATGYNGMPVGIDDHNIPWNRDADNHLETKYPYVCHAELNAILNATTSVNGCTLYVTLFPCNECAKAVIQAGIKKVVFLDDKYHDVEYSIASRKLLDLANVKQEKYTGEIPSIFFQKIKFKANGEK